MKRLKLLMTACLTMALVACSDDSDSNKPIPVCDTSQLVYDEQQTITEENGLTVFRDETGRVTQIQAFIAGRDDLEKLMAAPTSFEDIRYLFPLSEGNEIRLLRQGENPPIGETSGLGDLSHYPQYYEDYTQYYKGVPTGRWCRINYFGTPQGKRMSYVTVGPFIDIKGLDINPRQKEQQARQVLADYLEVERDDSWPCELKIREYSTRKDGKIQRDIRLVYFITGPYALSDPDVMYYDIILPRYQAEVDAHTGQLVIVYGENL